MPTEASSAPNGIRTRAAALKGRCPRPLDDGGSTVIAAVPLAPAVGDCPSIGDEARYRQSAPPASRRATCRQAIGGQLLTEAAGLFSRRSLTIGINLSRVVSC